MKPKTKKRAKWRSFATMAMFILLPAASWYYLQTGAIRQMDARAELKDYGQVRSVSEIDENGDKVNLIENKISIIHHFEKGGEFTESDKEVLDVYGGLYGQFKERGEDFCLVIVTEKPSAKLRNHVLSLKGNDNPMWVTSRAVGTWKTILMNSFEYYIDDVGVESYAPYIALADKKGKIRRFYNPKDAKELKSLIHHIGLLLPQ